MTLSSLSVLFLVGFNVMGIQYISSVANAKWVSRKEPEKLLNEAAEAKPEPYNFESLPTENNPLSQQESQRHDYNFYDVSSAAKMNSVSRRGNYIRILVEKNQIALEDTNVGTLQDSTEDTLFEVPGLPDEIYVSRGGVGQVSCWFSKPVALLFSVTGLVWVWALMTESCFLTTYKYESK